MAVVAENYIRKTKKCSSDNYIFRCFIIYDIIEERRFYITPASIDSCNFLFYSIQKGHYILFCSFDPFSLHLISFDHSETAGKNDLFVSIANF